MIFKDVDNKVHRRNLIIVDDDAIERLKFHLGFFDDLNVGNDLGEYISQRCSLCVCELFDLTLCQLNIC